MLLSSCKIALPQDLFQKLVGYPAQCRHYGQNVSNSLVYDAIPYAVTDVAGCSETLALEKMIDNRKHLTWLEVNTYNKRGS